MPSSHPSARRFIAAGLFDDVASFADLEGRISALGEQHTTAIGDAFEIFFEGYLATQPIMQADRAWLVKSINPDIRKALNLPADAKGIDGVYRTRTGDLIPYQVKFRSGRGTLTFTEVAPFLGVTDRAQAARLVVTNANELANDIKVRDGVFSLRGIDFDDLTKEDFAALASWLRDQPCALPKKIPRADQLEALARIEATFTTEPRATVVMACGTGKTLVQLWAAEQLRPKTVLVLVPSLALLQQTLAVWSHEHSWGDRFVYLAVCSDPTVATADDAIRLSPQDVDFRVNTDPAVVRGFLSSGTDAVKVVFSTYQSARVVAEGSTGLKPFDVGIFDEAHKTTVPSGGTFAAALSDEIVPIHKRLFFTATPRHYDVRHRDKEDNFRVVSMDDRAVYGPVTYELTFGEAVQREIICDYRVVIAAVNPQEITDFALNHGITLVEGDLIAARWVAGLLAVQKAVAETHASKVISFHSRVRLAKEFAGETPRGVGRYLPNFAIGHVNGEMRTSDRRSILQGFRSDRSLLVTNARCLTEGVDLPAVDMVAFVDPRRSRIDIAQAMGRAMRRPPESHKQFGYVVVPLLTSIEGTHLDGGSWAEVVDVLNAMREVDGRLVDIIRELKEREGRGDVFNPTRLAERVMMLGPAVAFEVLEREIYVAIVDRIGVSWDAMFGQLIAFKASHGHCNVPAIFPANPSLGNWVSAQRQRQPFLSHDRIARLNALGFQWNPLDVAWERMYLELLAFHQRYGHGNVPQDFQDNPSLGRWLATQRGTRRQGRLSADHLARLETVGVVWSRWDSDRWDAAWETHYQELVAFQEQHGRGYVPVLFPDNLQLGKWCAKQREAKRRGRLSADRITRLEALGFVWDPLDAVWAQRYQELVIFKGRHGHCEVPQKYPANPALGTWLQTQRKEQRRGAMPAPRVAKLEALGLRWSLLDAVWDERYQQLASFQQEHGHGNVPNTFPTGLGKWVNTQRQAKRRGVLSAKRAAQLESLGVDWNFQAAAWDERYQELVAFQRQAGHCNVPEGYRENPKLAGWVSQQRRRMRKAKLSADRVARLDALGFVWQVKNRS